MSNKFIFTQLSPEGPTLSIAPILACRSERKTRSGKIVGYLTLPVKNNVYRYDDL